MNLCNRIIADIVEFLIVYTLKFIYVIVLLITSQIFKMHVDFFCNKVIVWNGSRFRKDKILTEINWKENHSKKKLQL